VSLDRSSACSVTTVSKALHHVKRVKAELCRTCLELDGGLCAGALLLKDDLEFGGVLRIEL
jgi:hypothetical protein